MIVKRDQLNCRTELEMERDRLLENSEIRSTVNTSQYCNWLSELIELRKELEEQKLSTMQRLYLTHIRLHGAMTVSEIVKETKCSVQSASGILRAIYRKGYLEREERKQESGGTEYVYTPKPQA